MRDSYQNHINLVGGAVGPSSGDINSTYFGIGYRLEREMAQNWRLGGMTGIGAFNYNLDGSFNASGTVPAIKLAVYALIKMNDKVSFGPGIEVIKPLGDISGFGGATPSNVSFGTVRQVKFGFRFRF